MRRFLALIAALVAMAALVAQSDEPSEDSVLQKAREKYEAWQQSQGSAPFGEDSEAPESGERREREVPFTPFYLGFVPGLSVPFGYYDVAFSASTIGAINRDIEGFQSSGVFAMARDVQGFQAAGVFALARDIEGFQGAGVFNIADGKVEGFQGAGVFNIAGGLDGCQIAGVFNVAEDLRAPIQLAGVFNIAQDVEGAQVASVFNVARRVKGAQIASVLNQAARVDGIQVGLVNIADHLEGIQVGLVNIARNGVHGMGAVYEPATGYVYGHWQNGSRSLYTLLQAGLLREDWFNRGDSLILAAGLGSRILDFRAFYLDCDLSAAYELGPHLGAITDSLDTGSWDAFATSFGGRPYPSLRLSLGVPFLGRIHFIGGFRMDLDLHDYPGVPEQLKLEAGRRSHDWFGLSFDSYTKWFFGVRI